MGNQQPLHSFTYMTPRTANEAANWIARISGLNREVVEQLLQMLRDGTYAAQFKNIQLLLEEGRVAAEFLRCVCLPQEAVIQYGTMFSPLRLWEEQWDQLGEDAACLIRQERCNDALHVNKQEVQSSTLYELEMSLNRNARTLADVPPMPLSVYDLMDGGVNPGNRLIRDECEHNTAELSANAASDKLMLTADQKRVYWAIQRLMPFIEPVEFLQLASFVSGVLLFLIGCCFQVGAPMMRLRNLNAAGRLGNGSRLIVTKLGVGVLEGPVLRGPIPSYKLTRNQDSQLRS
ncbi:hypothetical protein PsorP6_005441 [Peronosclerospora sorghi]|uniref:Uncharacterized protein n=1 Tax=Peronosclerospora sorghi TaxID=230839 RepID=A0ACC0W5L7_9STRA|nr:hypothetical protein PsorP6_005441 [Peronosclerospora sorghi]